LVGEAFKVECRRLKNLICFIINCKPAIAKRPPPEPYKGGKPFSISVFYIVSKERKQEV
jgi:hypothetical protein